MTTVEWHINHAKERSDSLWEAIKGYLSPTEVHLEASEISNLLCWIEELKELKHQLGRLEHKEST